MSKDKYKHAIEIIENWERVEQFVQITPGCPMWAKVSGDPGYYKLEYLNHPGEFRIKPTSKMVPFGPEDIKPGMVFRAAGGADWYAFDGVSKFAIRINRSWINYEDLRKNWEYSTDGVTWNRCEKEAKG